jgi:capsid protein
MEAIAKGVWKAPGFFEDIRIRQAWTRCLWAGASPGSIDPLREIMASEHKVRLGVSTLEIESLEINGSDWRQNTLQSGIENKVCAENGLTYIRNLDTKGNPILTLGISDENGNVEPKQQEQDEELAA